MNTEMIQKRFTAIYNEQSDAIFKYCYFRTSNREQARDITQDVFMRFWDTLARQEPIKNERAFLFTIARHLVIDFYRKKKTLSLDALAETDEKGYYLPKDNSTEINAEARYLISKIEELGPEDRQIVYLRYVEDLKPKEIAEIIGVSANIVSIRLTRGLAKLRKIVGEN